MPKRRRVVERPPAEFDFFRFPVFFAFSAGLFVAALLMAFAPALFPLVSTVALLGVSFSIVHVLTHLWLRRRGGRRREKEEETERERRALAARAAAAREAASEGRPPEPQRHRRRRGRS